MANKIGMNLRDRLLALKNTKDYAVGVLTNCTEKHWEELLDIIKDHPEYDADRVALIALALGEE